MEKLQPARSERPGYYRVPVDAPVCICRCGARIVWLRGRGCGRVALDMDQAVVYPSGAVHAPVHFDSCPYGRDTKVLNPS